MYVGCGPHRAADEDGLADSAQRCGKIGMARSKGARRSFAMNEKTPEAAIDKVLLHLARVV
jgi:hypothetical protein